MTPGNRRLSRLSGDVRGASAVEFALLAPVIIAIYFGLAEFCQGYMAQKRMGHVSALVADLVAQQQAVATQNLDDFFAIGGPIMEPFSASPLKQRVSNITQTAGVARVVWSYGHGLDPRGNDIIVLPAGLIDDDESIIMSEATYRYESPVTNLLEPVTFQHTYYLRPRNVASVPCSNCPSPPPP